MFPPLAPSRSERADRDDNAGGVRGRQEEVTDQRVAFGLELESRLGRVGHDRYNLPDYSWRVDDLGPPTRDSWMTTRLLGAPLAALADRNRME
jgi:hypothetical protein